MCSLRLNEPTLDALADLSKTGENKKQKYEKRLFNWANEANTQISGYLDNHDGSLSHMPPDLRHLRHYYLGRHRIYISGSHKNCFYLAWYIKKFKKDGRDVEGSEKFNNVLYKALNSPTNRHLCYDEAQERYVAHEL